jgi:hypothetical protein
VTDNSFAERVRGADGHTLREHWDATGMRAYNGTTVSGFPNFFLLLGPNTGTGHTSVVYMMEAQLPYVLGALRLLREDVAALDVRPDVEAAYNEQVQRKLSRSVWNTGGCVSWYLDSHGRNPTIWPDYTFRFAQRLRRFDVEAYYQELRSPEGAPRPGGAASPGR